MGGVSLQDEATVCRFDMLFYPGNSFTSNIDNLMAELKSTQSEIKPTPTYVPEPVVYGNSTTGAAMLGLPVVELPYTTGSGTYVGVGLISDCVDFSSAIRLSMFEVKLFPG